MTFWLGVGVGTVLGACLGWLLLALCVCSKRKTDDWMGGL